MSKKNNKKDKSIKKEKVVDQKTEINKVEDKNKPTKKITKADKSKKTKIIEEVEEIKEIDEFLNKKNTKKNVKVNKKITEPIEVVEEIKKVDKSNKNTLFKVFMIILIILCVGVVSGFSYYYLVLPSIKLKGSKRIVIEYGTTYKEKGYIGKHFGKDITSKVKVKDNINLNKLGKYEVRYSVKNKGLSNEVVRDVVVVDTKKPSMNIDASDAYVCPGDEYIKEQVIATDNYDGEISNKVKVDISKEKNKVIYLVSDSSNNTHSVTKNILYKDNEAPIIKLNGSEIIYSFVGEQFNDPLYTITDNCDSDFTNKVTITGGVDIYNVGEYNITYTVKDDAGNEASVSRKVFIKKRDAVGTIYLTFDDGPKEGTTNIILDILREEGVEATFFVTNSGPDYLIKRMYDEGHTVALHTASHDYQKVYSSVDAYYNDLYSVQERVRRITGHESKIIRFPGGSSNTVSRKYNVGIMSTLTQDVVNRGFKYYDWNLSSGDAAGGSPTANTIYNNVVNSLRKDRVNMVLMHDIKTYTRDSLRDIIRYGKNNGYTFEKITMDTTMIKQKVNN